ncbi:MAG: DUF3179 domain-containing protein [Desulfobacteraceae bacterium]|nr:DUF3179 domain-containing protein [Desulfobacteraceae bacterium]
MVYSRQVDDRKLSFGISGRLYKSNVLLYDHQTESLWSQLMSKAVSGPLAGRQLKQIQSELVSWKHWAEKHPRTLVLSTQTGYSRNYDIDPYKDYYHIGQLMFPVGRVRHDLSVKEHVLGISLNGQSKAYALSRVEAKRRDNQ